MQNQDILSQVCIYLTDEAIFQLYFSAELKKEVAKILSDNLFWKMRAEYLVGKQIDFESDYWSIIYYSLVAADKEESREFKFIHGLHDLDSLKVIELIYDLPKKISVMDENLVSTRINTLEILDYLLSNHTIRLDSFSIILRVIVSEVSYSTGDRIAYLLERLTKSSSRYEYGGTYTKKQLLEVITKAAIRGDAHILELILDYTIKIDGEKPKGSEVLAAVASGLNLDMWQLTVKILRSRLDKGQVRNIIENLEQTEDVSGIRFLIENQLVSLAAAEWRAILNKSIDKNKLQVVKYLLTVISPVTDGNQALKKAAINHTEMFRLVLSYPLISLDGLEEIIQAVLGPSSQSVSTKDNADRRKLLQRISSSTSNFELLSITPRQLQSLRALLQDNRVDIDKLTDRSLRLILAAYGTTSKSIILETLDKLTDPLVRYIVIKRPSKIELLDWMIESNKIEFAEAADLVLSSQSTDDQRIEPIRALLYSLLYPTASLEEILLDVDFYSKQAAEMLLELFKIAKW